MVMDFSGINYDYNDNVYVISNMRPAPPLPPAGVVATVQPSGGFLLSWQPPTDTLTRRYNVYRSLGTGGGFEKVTQSPVSDLQYLDPTAPPGATYFYKVTALDDWGGETDKGGVTAVRADYTPPPPPSGLSAAPQADGILLDWQPSVGADDLAGYRVFRSGSPNGPFTPLGGVITDTVFADTSAPGGFTWYYNVVAVDGNNNMSDPVTAVGSRPGEIGALLSPPPDVTTGGTTYSFVVTYSDNAVLGAESLADSIVVTGPNAFSQSAQAAAVDGHNVTYTITPPGGSWDAADAGTYTISMQPNKVGDGHGKFVPAAPLGTFQVNAPDGGGAVIDLGPLPLKTKLKTPGQLTPGAGGITYRFTLEQTSRLRSKLAKLRDDVAFDLRDASGTVLISSDKPKRRPEKLMRALPAGTYFLHVTLKGATGTNFLMNTLVRKPTKKDLKALGGS
jgi:hypothetical protein